MARLAKVLRLNSTMLGFGICASALPTIIEMVGYLLLVMRPIRTLRMAAMV